jgi:biotin operon repressor
MGLSENDTLKFISEFQQKGCPIKSVVQSIYKNTAFGNVAPFTKQSQA